MTAIREGIYFTGTTFTTIGFGDITPNGRDVGYWMVALQNVFVMAVGVVSLLFPYKSELSEKAETLATVQHLSKAKYWQYLKSVDPKTYEETNQNESPDAPIPGNDERPTMQVFWQGGGFAVRFSNSDDLKMVETHQLVKILGELEGDHVDEYKPLPDDYPDMMPKTGETLRFITRDIFMVTGGNPEKQIKFWYMSDEDLSPQRLEVTEVDKPKDGIVTIKLGDKTISVPSFHQKPTSTFWPGSSQVKNTSEWKSMPSAVEMHVGKRRFKRQQVEFKDGTQNERIGWITIQN